MAHIVLPRICSSAGDADLIPHKLASLSPAHPTSPSEHSGAERGTTMKSHKTSAIEPQAIVIVGDKKINKKTSLELIQVHHVE